MSNPKDFVEIKKQKSGDLILEINPDFFRPALKKVIKAFLRISLNIFLPIFSIFDKLAEKRKLVISGVGLGIGLGLSIIITQRPDTLQAFPLMSNQMAAGVEPRILRISQLDIYLSIKHDRLTSLLQNITTNELIHLDGSGFLGQKKPIIIADLSSKNLLNTFEEINIGDEIIIIGSNEGTYKYHVIEIRDTEAQYLPHVIAKEENSLIIYKPQNILRTQIFIVVAKPFK